MKDLFIELTALVVYLSNERLQYYRGSRQIAKMSGVSGGLSWNEASDLVTLNANKKSFWKSLRYMTKNNYCVYNYDITPELRRYLDYKAGKYSFVRI